MASQWQDGGIAQFAMAYVTEPRGQAQLPPMQLPLAAGAPAPSAPGSPMPSTPPRRDRQGSFRRVESSEKLPSPRRFRRVPLGLEGGGRSPPRGPVPVMPFASSAESSSSSGPAPTLSPAAAAPAPAVLGDEVDAPMVDVQQMRSRADGDEKYWAQIKFAHQLLSDSTCTELRLTEVVASNRTVFEPLFSEAIAAQESDRLSAVTMLRVLRQLVAEMDAEFSKRKALASTSRSELKAPAREPSEDVASKKAKCCDAAVSEDGMEVGEAAPQTPPTSGVASRSACAASGSTPLVTPQRRSVGSSLPERTPPPVLRPSKMTASAQPAEGLQKLGDTAEELAIAP